MERLPQVGDFVMFGTDEYIMLGRVDYHLLRLSRTGREHRHETPILVDPADFRQYWKIRP